MECASKYQFCYASVLAKIEKTEQKVKIVAGENQISVIYQLKYDPRSQHSQH